MIALAAVLAAVPAASLAIMAMVGLANPAAAIMAIVASLVAAFALAIVWRSDLELLADAVRHAASRPHGPRQPTRTPVIPAIDRVVRALERLARHAAQHAEGTEQRLRADEAIIERLPDPLIVLGADRQIRRTNEAARGAFGSDFAAVLRHPDLRAAIDRTLATAENGAPAVQTAAVALRAPVPRDVHATIIPMRPMLPDEGIVLLLSDRTRERALERMRADFIANASHELRTPLASLIGFIDTLLGPAADDPPAQQRFLGIMADQAARMNRLIDDLMNLSRVELVEHQAPAEPVALDTILSRIAAGFEPRLRERKVTLDLACPTALPKIPGDADQLAQVVQNLLDNAIKYGREGGKVSVAAAPSSDPRFPPRPGVLLTVSDEGQGIEREHLPRLTERFYRVDKGRSRQVGGTGLGLAIVKHVVNRHRGQMRIDSEIGKGTTVTIWLPQIGSAVSAQPAEEHPPAPPPATATA